MYFASVLLYCTPRRGIKTCKFEEYFEERQLGEGARVYVRTFAAAAGEK